MAPIAKKVAAVTKLAEKPAHSSYLLIFHRQNAQHDVKYIVYFGLRASTSVVKERISAIARR